ncbi:hypothetical protein [Bradyrhizobium sp.]|uniref:hypothetical protein n=1 Tax=Bradyrhizobium sp. TaxID=376 RepID=UPI000ADB874D|nr:hypothetical protein [Bradyrhizobium sp.]
MRHAFLRLIAAPLLFAFIGSAADAQILNQSNIEQICKSSSATHRRTLVYVDLSSIIKGRTEWGLTLINRLELGAREPLTILSVNPNTFETVQAFDLCYPTLTKSEIESARAGRGQWARLVSSDPEDQQRENLQTFDARLKNALDKILGEATKFQAGARKNILGALAFDKNRFSDRSAFYRIIVFSDAVLVDPDIEKSTDVAKYVSALNIKYPATFYGADVSLFGVSEGSDSHLNLQTREKIFDAYLLASWGQLKSFSSSLPAQRNDPYSAVTRLEGSFEGGSSQGAARIAYSTPNSSQATGWVTFVIGRSQLYLPFEGALECDGDQCKLSASASESVPPLAQSPYFRKGDRISLQGKRDARLEGSLTTEAKEVFKDGNQEAKYTLKFQKP